MNTLVLRHVPDGLYRRLKAVAAGLKGGAPRQRPSAEEIRRWLEQQVWALPLLDHHQVNEILGYGGDGLCS